MKKDRTKLKYPPGQMLKLILGGLERELEKAGCKPGDLKLVVLTHGDFDHTGNA
ncbi:hypothetical protein DRO91_10540, partial [Candidatus Heimdallarchaeota archaeon]